MGVGDEGVIDVTLSPIPNPIESGKRIGAVAAGIGASIEDEPRVTNLEKVTACANVRRIPEGKKFHKVRYGRTVQ
jgi:hypothetical protein